MSYLRCNDFLECHSRVNTTSLPPKGDGWVLDLRTVCLVSFCRERREGPHWKRRFVSALTKLAFNSSSVKLQATANGHQEELDHLAAYK